MSTSKTFDQLKSSIGTGAIFTTCAIILGALGAHYIKSHITPDRFLSFQTGLDYHLFTGLSITFSPILERYLPLKKVNTFVKLILWGTILFSGSIYLLSTKDWLDLPQLSVLGPITPIGGLLITGGWLFLGISALRK